MAGKAITGGTKTARRAAQRRRGFPLSWEVKANRGWFRKCDRPLASGKKKAGHTSRWIIEMGDWRSGAPGSQHVTCCLNCATFQQAQAIRWAAEHGNTAEAFR